VKRLRETRNFSQRGLAINAGVTQGLIHQIETGKVQDARSHAVVSPAPRRPVKEPLWWRAGLGQQRSGFSRALFARARSPGPALSLSRRLRPLSAAALNTRSDVETEEVMTRVLSSDSKCVDVGAHNGSIWRVI